MTDQEYEQRVIKGREWMLKSGGFICSTKQQRVSKALGWYMGIMDFANNDEQRGIAVTNYRLLEERIEELDKQKK